MFKFAGSNPSTRYPGANVLDTAPHHKTSPFLSKALQGLGRELPKINHHINHPRSKVYHIRPAYQQLPFYVHQAYNFPMGY